MLKPSTRALLQAFRIRRKQVGRSNLQLLANIVDLQRIARAEFGSHKIAGWLTQSKSALNLIDG